MNSSTVLNKSGVTKTNVSRVTCADTSYSTFKFSLTIAHWIKSLTYSHSHQHWQRVQFIRGAIVGGRQEYTTWWRSFHGVQASEVRLPIHQPFIIVSTRSLHFQHAVVHTHVRLYKLQSSAIMFKDVQAHAMSRFMIVEEKDDTLRIPISRYVFCHRMMSYQLHVCSSTHIAIWIQHVTIIRHAILVSHSQKWINSCCKAAVQASTAIDSLWTQELSP